MKYKVGDKVKIVSDTSGHKFKVGSFVAVQQVLKNTYFCDGKYVSALDCEHTHTFTHPKDAPDGHKWEWIEGGGVTELTAFTTTMGEAEYAGVLFGKVCTFEEAELKDAPAEPKVMWVNVDADGHVRALTTRQEANLLAYGDRIACIRVEYHEGQYDE